MLTFCIGLVVGTGLSVAILFILTKRKKFFVVQVVTGTAHLWGPESKTRCLKFASAIITEHQIVTEEIQQILEPDGHYKCLGMACNVYVLEASIF